MARVSGVEIDEVPEEVRPIYRRYSTEYGPFLDQVRVFAHRPPALKHIMGLLLELSDEQVLPKRYSEIAVVTVSKINECKYCVAQHTRKLVEQGLSAETAETILEPEVPGFDDVDYLVRDYAADVTNNFQYMRDEIFERLKRHFTEEQIVELTLRTALCGFFNRFNDALQIEGGEGAVADLLTHEGAQDGHRPHAPAAE